MEQVETQKKPFKGIKIGKKMLPVILALVLLLVLGGLWIYTMIAGVTIGDLMESLAPEKTEQSMVLDEFLVNLNSNVSSSAPVLRIHVAIKYLDEKNHEKIAREVPMIRDLILANLMDLRLESVLDEASLSEFKASTKDALNEYFEEEIVTQVYVTDMIIR